MNTEIVKLANRVVAGMEDGIILSPIRKREMAEQVMRSFLGDLPEKDMARALEDAILKLKRPPLWRLRRVLLYFGCPFWRLGSKDPWGGSRISADADHRRVLSSDPPSLLQP